MLSGGGGGVKWSALSDSGTHRESSGRQLLLDRHCHYRTAASRRMSGDDHPHGDEIDDDLYQTELYYRIHS